MKTLLSTKNEKILLSDEDYNAITIHTWYVNKNGYAERQVQIAGKRKAVYLHYLIIGKPPEGKIVDHINGNKLDNRKENLRFITRQQNQYNRHKDRGISFARKKWVAYIHHDYKKIHLGSFTTREEALKKRKEAEKLHFVYT